MFEISPSPVTAVIVTHDGDVGAGVRDEDLRAVDDPLAVLESRGRARRAGVGAGVRLGQPERGELRPDARSGSHCPLLLLGAEVVDRQRAEGVVRGDGDRDRRVDPRQLLDRDRVRERVGARAAVLLRDRHPHQPELGELGDELVREALLAVELLGDRRDLLERELPHGVAEQLVLVLEIEVQREPLRELDDQPHAVAGAALVEQRSPAARARGSRAGDVEVRPRPVARELRRNSAASTRAALAQLGAVLHVGEVESMKRR